MSYKSKKPDELRESDTLFFHAEDISEPTIVVRWGDLKEHLRNELLSSFPEMEDDSPASIDPEFLKPAPQLVREEESDKPKNSKSTYKVEFVCLNSCKEGEVKSHTCTACSEEEAIEETKRHCKVIQCDYRMAIGIWKDGLWYSAGDLAVQNPQKAKDPSPFNTYLVKYEYKTYSAVSTDVHAVGFVAIAADKIDAVNKLMKHLEILNRHFHRLRSVERYDHSHKDNNQ